VIAECGGNQGFSLLRVVPRVYVWESMLQPGKPGLAEEKRVTMFAVPSLLFLRHTYLLYTFSSQSFSFRCRAAWPPKRRTMVSSRQVCGFEGRLCKEQGLDVVLYHRLFCLMILVCLSTCFYFVIGSSENGTKPTKYRRQITTYCEKFVLFSLSWSAFRTPARERLDTYPYLSFCRFYSNNHNSSCDDETCYQRFEALSQLKGFQTKQNSKRLTFSRISL
jgi:hypothetical protein